MAKMILLDDNNLNELYLAVQKYIESKGGTAVVIGGIEIQQWPEDLSHTYRIAIKITGKLPDAPEEEKDDVFDADNKRGHEEM